MANIILYYPPTGGQTPSEDPGATLTGHPCVQTPCCSLHEQLALIIYLMAQYTSAGTAAQLETATKRFRGMSESDMRAFMIDAFSDVLIAGGTADALKEFNRLSDQKLKEMFVYLWKLVFQVL